MYNKHGRVEFSLTIPLNAYIYHDTSTYTRMHILLDKKEKEKFSDWLFDYLFFLSSGFRRAHRLTSSIIRYC